MRQGNFRFGLIAIGLAVMLAMRPSALAIRRGPIRAAGWRPGGTQIPQPPDNSVNWPGAGYGPARCSATCSTSRPS